MSENGEIYSAGNKFYTATGSDGMEKSHLCCWVCWFDFDVDNNVDVDVERALKGRCWLWTLDNIMKREWHRALNFCLFWGSRNWSHKFVFVNFGLRKSPIIGKEKIILGKKELVSVELFVSLWNDKEAEVRSWLSNWNFSRTLKQTFGRDFNPKFMQIW